MDSKLLPIVRNMLFENELGSDPNLITRFSDPDGLRSGKSGYSFGISQFDIENNWTGILCLKECGFRPKDLDRLFEQSGSITDLNKRLRENSETVLKYDEMHMLESIEHVQRVLARTHHNYSELTLATILNLVDYHNQFYLSIQGKMHKWMLDQSNLNSSMILDFKLNNTLWGSKNPSDINRRYRNIETLLKDNFYPTSFI